MRLPAFVGRHRVAAVVVAFVLVLGIVTAVLPYVGGGSHGISPIP